MTLPEKCTETAAVSARAESGTSEPSKGKEIISVLHNTQHRTYQYPNGMTVGVRLQAIPGTRGVHVAVVHVLDLRYWRSGKSDLAMKAEVLERTCRPLDRILDDVGLSGLVSEKAIVTPWGHVRLELLRAMTEKGGSMVHETRTVYVVTDGVRPTRDLSWLTDQRRVVSPEEFSFACQSDIRSATPDVRRVVAADKWQGLQSGVERGWYGVLLLVFSVASALVSFGLAVTISGPVLPTLLSTTAAGIVGVSLLMISRRQLRNFSDRLRLEHTRVSELADWSRISKTVSENEEPLRVVGDLQFTIEPLMAATGEALESGNAEGAVSLACCVLDECVKLTPAEVAAESTPLETSDKGLGRFIGLLRYLGSDADEWLLVLAYVGLTGHLSSPITFGEAVSHISQLNNALYDVGVLRVDVKDAIDDLMNFRAMSETADRLGEMLALPEDRELSASVPVLSTAGESESVIEEKLSADRRGHEDTTDLLESMRRSRVLTSSDAPSATANDSQACDYSEESRIPMRAADIVSAKARELRERPSEPSGSEISASEVTESDPPTTGGVYGFDSAEE